MRFNRVCLAVVFVLVIVSNGRSQDTHVITTYIEKDKRTVVATDPLYVENTPSQFAQITFSFGYSGKQMTKAPEQISVGIWSVTKEQRYRKDINRKLYIVADGERFSSSEQTYLVLRGETFKGKDTFFSENRSSLGLQVSLPEIAQVKSGGVNGLYMEQIYMLFKPATLMKVAGAKSVEVFIGGQKLNFSEHQINTIREFARRLSS